MRIIFAGTPEFAVPCLQTLLASSHDICAVYTQPDRPSGRGRKLQPSPVKALAIDAGIPVFQPLTVNNEQELQQIQTLNADLMVVVAYGMILTQAVLDTPRLGCINVHASLLPRWRGAAPIQRALMAGDSHTGITIMKIVRKLDAGDMLHKEECLIAPNDTASDLHDKLAHLGAIGLTKVLAQIEEDALRPQVQDESLVTYAEKLEKSEAEIDWQQSATVIARKIRGLNSWPVAQTHYQGGILRIWQAEVVGDEYQLLPLSPGTVHCMGKNLLVKTGDNWIRLLEVQLPGGKRLSADAFLNAHAIQGVHLGNGSI